MSVIEIVRFLKLLWFYFKYAFQTYAIMGFFLGDDVSIIVKTWDFITPEFFKQYLYITFISFRCLVTYQVITFSAWKLSIKELFPCLIVLPDQSSIIIIHLKHVWLLITILLYNQYQSIALKSHFSILICLFTNH